MFIVFLNGLKALSLSELAFFVQLVAACYMTGVIWVMQFVQYPLFKWVGTAGFAEYEALHCRWITPVVGPPMLLEVAAALYMWLYPPAWVPKWALFVLMGLLGLIWFATALFSVPLHGVLAQGFDLKTYHHLLNTNWLRTFAWTARALLLAGLLLLRWSQLNQAIK